MCKKCLSWTQPLFDFVAENFIVYDLFILLNFLIITLTSSLSDAISYHIILRAKNIDGWSETRSYGHLNEHCLNVQVVLQRQELSPKFTTRCWKTDNSNSLIYLMLRASQKCECSILETRIKYEKANYKMGVSFAYARWKTCTNADFQKCLHRFKNSPIDLVRRLSSKLNCVHYYTPESKFENKAMNGPY